MHWSLPDSSVHRIFQARILEQGCHFLLQGIFPTQGSNPGLLHCGQILYRLSYPESPKSLWSPLIFLIHLVESREICFGQCGVVAQTLGSGVRPTWYLLCEFSPVDRNGFYAVNWGKEIMQLSGNGDYCCCSQSVSRHVSLCGRAGNWQSGTTVLKMSLTNELGEE